MSAKSILFTRLLPELNATSPYFDKAAIVRMAREFGLEIKPGTLRVYLTTPELAATATATAAAAAAAVSVSVSADGLNPHVAGVFSVE